MIIAARLINNGVNFDSSSFQYYNVVLAGSDRCRPRKAIADDLDIKGQRIANLKTELTFLDQRDSYRQRSLKQRKSVLA